MAMDPREPDVGASELPDAGCVRIAPARATDGSIDWIGTRAKVQEAYAGIPPDALGTPAWQPAYNQLWAQEHEREIVARMQEVDARMPATPLTRVDLGDGSSFVFAVDAPDEGAVTPAQQARLTAFSDAAQVCAVKTEDADPSKRLDVYFTCLGKELRAKETTP